jgi:hypothetical protein
MIEKIAKKAPFCVVGPNGILHCVASRLDVAKKRLELGLVGHSFRESGVLQYVQCDGNVGTKPAALPCPEVSAGSSVIGGWSGGLPKFPSRQ